MTADFAVDVDRNRLADVCRRYGIATLFVFGSVARGASTSSSDLDLLYELRPGARLGWRSTIWPTSCRRSSAVLSTWCRALPCTRCSPGPCSERHDSSMQRDLLLLHEMIDAAEQAQHLVKGCTADEITANRMRRDSLLWNFTVLGEAAGLVSDDEGTLSRHSLAQPGAVAQPCRPRLLVGRRRRPVHDRDRAARRVRPAPPRCGGHPGEGSVTETCLRDVAPGTPTSRGTGRAAYAEERPRCDTRSPAPGRSSSSDNRPARLRAKASRSSASWMVAPTRTWSSRSFTVARATSAWSSAAQIRLMIHDSWRRRSSVPHFALLAAVGRPGARCRADPGHRSSLERDRRAHRSAGRSRVRGGADSCHRRLRARHSRGDQLLVPPDVADGAL